MGRRRPPLLEVEHLVVVALDHVDGPPELLPVGLGVHLQEPRVRQEMVRIRMEIGGTGSGKHFFFFSFYLGKERDLLDGDNVGLAPLHTDPGVEVVQLTGAQGDSLVLILEWEESL